jgi:hypothetical protein
MKTSFEWSENKNKKNQKKHRVDFKLAQRAFFDKRRVIHKDLAHSKTEKRYYCFAKVKGKILTVRFTYRNDRIRIIGAGFWRKGKKIYEKNQIH